MKSLILIFALATLNTSFGETQSTAEISTFKNLDTRTMLKGFTLGVTKGINPDIDMELSLQYDGFELGSGEEELKSPSQDIAIKLGYQNIKSRLVSFSTFITFNNYEASDLDIKGTRIEGNATYGINEKSYVYGGLNTNSLKIEDYKFKRGFGLQVGGGYIIDQQTAISLSYYRTSNSTTDVIYDPDSGIFFEGKLDVKVSALEMALNYTF